MIFLCCIVNLAPGMMLYKKMKSGHECANNANEKSLGEFDTLEECFKACKEKIYNPTKQKQNLFA